MWVFEIGEFDQFQDIGACVFITADKRQENSSAATVIEKVIKESLWVRKKKQRN